jgi:hypothetical protein
MPRYNPRSGRSLVLIGILGTAFFWITDPRYGQGLRWSQGENPIDLANQHFPGTLVGVAGSLLIFFIGLILLLRKPT